MRDVVVVGAGVIGLSIAHRLQSEGYGVVVKESRRVLDQAEGKGVATLAAGGMIAPLSEGMHTHSSELLNIMMCSSHMYPDWVRQIESQSAVNTGYMQEGTYHLAMHEDHLAELDHQMKLISTHGYRVESVEAKDVCVQEGYLKPIIKKGFFSPTEAVVDPHSLIKALEKAFVSLGGRIEFGSEIKELSASHVTVVAAGAWTPSLLPSTAVRPVKGQTLAVQCSTKVLKATLRTPEVYIIPRKVNADGSQDIVLGATAEEVGFDAEPTTRGVVDLLRHATHVLPVLGESKWLGVSVGFRPTGNTEMPAMEEVENNVFVAAGHGRHGILLAPYTADLIYQKIAAKS